MPLTSFHNAPLVQLRGQAWMALEDTGHVLTKGTATDDGGGGATFAPTTGTAIPCRVDPVGAESGEVADQVNERTTHVITVAPGTTITESDSFSITGRGTYEITAVRARTQEQIRELEAVKAQ